MDGKTTRLAAGLVVVASAIFLALLWQPARQVRLHQEHLLRAVGKRNWQAVGRFIAAEYHDRWGHDKENVILRTAQVFGQFLWCEVRAEERTLAISEGSATLAARLTLAGTGGPIAEYAKQRVSVLDVPFTFHWMRRSWKPWDWVLVEVDQPQLEIGEMPEL